MARFVARRVGMMALVALAIVYFGFLGVGMARNSQRSRPNLNVAVQAEAAWKASRQYLARAVQGDFGQVATRRGSVPVRDILADTYPKSMGLLLTALGVAAALGLTVGTVAALAKRSPLVLLLLMLTVLGISTPTFFAALLLQVANVRILQNFQFRLAFSGGFGWDRHMVLPVLVLAARPLAYLTRAAFLSLSRVMEEDYIRTAWAKGLNLALVLNRHALRNVAVPILTALGVSLRFALGSLPVVEYFFAWPGMGDRLLDAIRAGESEVVVTIGLALGLTFLLVNLLLDVLYRLVDPRMKEGEAL